MPRNNVNFSRSCNISQVYLLFDPQFWLLLHIRMFLTAVQTHDITLDYKPAKPQDEPLGSCGGSGHPRQGILAQVSRQRGKHEISQFVDLTLLIPMHGIEGVKRCPLAVEMIMAVEETYPQTELERMSQRLAVVVAFVLRVNEQEHLSKRAAGARSAEVGFVGKHDLARRELWVEQMTELIWVGPSQGAISMAKAFY